jgi:pentose-5-phosphate-3-epimerase
MIKRFIRQRLQIVWQTLSLILLLTLQVGCSTSANVRLERIDDTKAIVKYDRGALIKSDGKEKAEKLMSEHCSGQGYTTLVAGERVSGEKRWTKTIVFECVGRTDR